MILAAGAAVTATVVLAVSLSTGDDRGSDPVTSAVAADYTGSSWRLTQVQEGAQSTAIPAELGAGMRLFPDGVLQADDGVNTIGGRFTRTPDGFTVANVSTTLVGYAGDDPHQRAAIQAFAAITHGPRPTSPPSSSASITIVSVDHYQLVLDAGSLRLTFRRIGPAVYATAASSAAHN